MGVASITAMLLILHGVVEGYGWKLYPPLHFGHVPSTAAIHLHLVEVLFGIRPPASKPLSHTGYTVASLNSIQPARMDMMSSLMVPPPTGQLPSLMNPAIL